MTQRLILPLALAFALPLAACQEGADEPAPPESPTASAEAAAAPTPTGLIGENEKLQLTGTEPFWGGHIEGKALTYTNPENPDGTIFTVERLASEGGITFSGMAEHPDLELTVTAKSCSDGMSDRTYPFTVTFNTGMESLNGCAWSTAHPYEGPANP